jgi:hypothetical protein
MRERKFGGAANLQERPLASLDFGARMGQPRGGFGRDETNAVLVGVNQVARKDFDSAQAYWRTEFHDSHISMTDTRIQAEKLKPQGTDFVEVTGTTAGNMSHATEFLMNCRRDFAELGAQTRRVVEVLPHSNQRGSLGRDVSQVIGEHVD